MSISSMPANAILRIAFGIMLTAHGLLKWLVFTLPGTAAFFDSVGFPGWMAYPVTFAEIIGGVLLILGFYVRPVALLTIPVMLGATWVHLPNGWVFSNPNGGWEYPLFLAIVSLVLFIQGSDRSTPASENTA